MALIFPGKTTCSLCGKVIFNEDEIVGFPAFIPKSHRLHQFSEGVFHKSCFQEWEDKEEFENLFQKHQAIWESRPMNLKSAEEIENWGKEAFKKIFKE